MTLVASLKETYIQGGSGTSPLTVWCFWIQACDQDDFGVPLVWNPLCYGWLENNDLGLGVRSVLIKKPETSLALEKSF